MYGYTSIFLEGYLLILLQMIIVRHHIFLALRCKWAQPQFFLFAWNTAKSDPVPSCSDTVSLFMSALVIEHNRTYFLLTGVP